MCKQFATKPRRVYVRIPLADRFWKYVAKTETCWLWTGAIESGGYGVIIAPDKKNHKAHRVSWELHRGIIPNGLFVCHACDVRHCVNPEHLWLGTARDNIRDASRKGRLCHGDTHHSHIQPKVRGEANGRAKLTDHHVRIIRQQYATGKFRQVDLSVEHGVSQILISLIVRRKAWRHID